jgi:DNA-binding MarR family transcriptional regulator
MSEWTFVTNHAVILSYIGRHPSITARDLAVEIGITERAVRRIIAELDSGGYIAKAKEGRRVRYTVNPRLSLRHKTQSDKIVGDLLYVLGWKSGPSGKKGKSSRPRS